MNASELRCVVGLLVAGVILWSLPVQAVPAACSGTLDERFYNIGLSMGNELVSLAWTSIENDCYRLEEFDHVITNFVLDYELAPEPSQIFICRYSGFVEGVLQAIEDVYNQCETECCARDRLIGEVSALGYCGLSFALDGLTDADLFERRPVPYCYVCCWVSCDDSFDTITYTLVDDKWDNPDTEDVHEGECWLYTDRGELDPDTGEPRWGAIWDQVREIQCSSWW